MARTIDEAFNDEAIERSEKTESDYSFWLKGIPVEVVSCSLGKSKAGRI